MIELPKLEFETDALEPHISKATIETHHGKHLKGYVDNLNKLIEGTDFEKMDLLEIIRRTSTSKGPIYNNAAQIYNHDFYFKCLSPEGGEPGDLAQWKDDLFTTAKMHFGSGWVWLVYRKAEDSVGVIDTHDAETPFDNSSAAMEQTPLLVIDVWEHAYYIDHKNDRGKYLEAIWNVLNWNFVKRNMEGT